MADQAGSKPSCSPPAGRGRAAAPALVRRAAAARAAARRDRDWPTADRLRADIEAAGWTVIDSGAAFRLEPSHPADVVDAGGVRYGRSGAVPSRLGEADSGLATVVVVAREDPAGAGRAVAALLAHSPTDVEVVLVLDGVADPAGADLAAAVEDEPRVEVVRTSAALGQGAALNIGLRRSRGRIVIVLDASIEPTGDVVTPLAVALDSSDAAIAGPFGLASPDLRHFEEVVSGPAAAIEGYVMAFRRADAASRGPFDERFRFYRNLDVWWSLVLRDASIGVPARAAVVVAELPIARHEHVAWTATPVAERDRLSKRNFYRVLERFRDRLDLVIG